MPGTPPTNPPRPEELKESLRAEALRQGFSTMGIASAEALRNRQPELRAWLRNGLAGPLGYMDAFFERQARFLADFPDLRSVVVLAAPYSAEACGGASAGAPGSGRIARYAAGSDYHSAMQARLARLESALRRHSGSPANLRVKRTVDTRPVLERALAEAAGIGFFGKNTCLIRPKGGSFFFLAALLTNLPLEADQPVAWDCGNCTLCLQACPTGALPEPYRLDASRCIATLTIELRGSIPNELRPRMGNWIFGCDICQEVCPYNHPRTTEPWPELQPASGPGTAASLKKLLTCRTRHDFATRFAPTALSRPGREGLLRNAAIAAGNLADPDLVPALADCLQADPSPIVRRHAAWALGRIPHPNTRALLLQSLQSERNPDVLREIEQALETATGTR